MTPHFVHWFRNPRWCWGYEKFYGYGTIYYSLSFGKISFQAEIEDR